MYPIPGGEKAIFPHGRKAGTPSVTDRPASDVLHPRTGLTPRPRRRGGCSTTDPLSSFATGTLEQAGFHRRLFFRVGLPLPGPQR